MKLTGKLKEPIIDYLTGRLTIWSYVKKKYKLNVTNFLYS